MRLLQTSQTANFMFPKGLSALPNLFKRGVKSAKPLVEGAESLAEPLVEGSVSLAEAMTEAQKLHNTSKWGNRINAAMLATTPIGLAPLVMKDADTKAIEAMRVEDKRREALGLPPLATNKQIKEQPVSTGFSKTNGDIRIIDLTPSNIVKL